MTITVTLADVEERAFLWALEQQNKRLRELGDAEWTAEQFVQRRLGSLVSGYRTAIQHQLTTQFFEADAETQQRILALLEQELPSASADSRTPQ